MPTATKCTGTNQDGSTCQHKAKLGAEVCGLHSPGRRPRKRKRTRNFGSIRTLPSGRLQASYLADGTRHAQTFEKGKKRDAERWLSNAETDLGRGHKPVNKRAANITFSEYAEDWFAAGVKRGDWRKTTEGKYRGLLDRYILPTFGKLTLKDVTPARVRTWNADLASQHRSTSAGAYRLLSSIFNRIVDDEIGIPRTPCRVKGASDERRQTRPYASEKAVRAAIDAIPERERCGAMLAAWGQLRRSEILGLQRQDIDFERGTARIERGVTNPETRGLQVVDDTKTKSSRRTIYLPEFVLQAVKAQLEFVGPEPVAWLFPGKDPEAPMNARTLVKPWERVRDRVSEPGKPLLTLHDLRVLGLTWAAQNGATLRELMNRAGHDDVNAAMGYQLAADERDKDIAAKFDKTHEQARAS